MPSHNKGQIQTLLDSNPAYVDHAIRLLGQNQTADELRVKDTRYHNDIGFSAAHARTGTRLFEFVTGISTKSGKPTWAPKSLSHPAADRVHRPGSRATFRSREEQLCCSYLRAPEVRTTQPAAMCIEISAGKSDALNNALS